VTKYDVDILRLTVSAYELFERPSYAAVLVRPSERHIEKSRLNWKPKISNTADNAGITQSQTRHTTHFRVKIGEIGPFTFIRRPGILKRIAISCLPLILNGSPTMIWLHRVNIW